MHAIPSARRILFCLPAILFVLGLSSLAAQAPVSTKAQLSIDFIDVEGGQATLFITPTGESLLIDTGWGGHDFRDANRIAEAARQAGLSRIDFVLITHYHDDHVGGVPQLVSKIPVGTFIDHGLNRELDSPQTVANYAAYQRVLASGNSKHILAHPEDRLPIQGMDVTVISADGAVRSKPSRAGAGANQFCGPAASRPAADTTENARSLGVEITFGELTILDLGDLTADKEWDLMCPADKLGPVDVLVVSHHGFNQSSSAALVDKIHPRVAIMDNGAKKGGSTSVLKTVAQAPGLETLWQLHFSEEGGPANNTDEKFVANPPGPDAGYGLQLHADRDGSFQVVNSRTGFAQHYPAKP